MSLHATTLRGTRSRPASTVEAVARVRTDGEDWCVRESRRDEVLGPDAPDWFALEGESRAERIKSGQGRAIWRVTLKTGTVFAKVATAERLWDRAKWLIVGSPGEREWRVSREAERRSLPVVCSLAVGVQGGPRPGSALLTEGLREAVTLRTAWEQGATRQTWRTRLKEAGPLIDTVARLFAVSHDSGLVHADNHPDNIMLVRDEGGAWADAFYVDVHSSGLSAGPASRRHCNGSIAQLDQFFHRCATRTERLRFVRSYLEQRRAAPGRADARPPLREFAGEITSARQRHGKRLARQRNRRLRRDGKYFAALRLSGGWRARVALRLERRHVFAEGDVPDRTTGQWRAILTPISEGLGRGEPVEDAANRNGLELEVSLPRGPLQRVSWVWGGPGQRKVFEQCHRRRHRDETADLILAYVEHRRAGLVDATFLVRPERATGAGVATVDTERADD